MPYKICETCRGKGGRISRVYGIRASAWFKCTKCEGRGYRTIRPYLNQEEREAIRSGTTRGHVILFNFELLKLFTALCRVLRAHDYP